MAPVAKARANSTCCSPPGSGRAAREVHHPGIHHGAVHRVMVDGAALPDGPVGEAPRPTTARTSARELRRCGRSDPPGAGRPRPASSSPSSATRPWHAPAHDGQRGALAPFGRAVMSARREGRPPHRRAAPAPPRLDLQPFAHASLPGTRRDEPQRPARPPAPSRGRTLEEPGHPRDEVPARSLRRPPAPPAPGGGSTPMKGRSACSDEADEAGVSADGDRSRQAARRSSSAPPPERLPTVCASSVRRASRCRDHPRAARAPAPRARPAGGVEDLASTPPRVKRPPRGPPRSSPGQAGEQAAEAHEEARG